MASRKPPTPPPAPSSEPDDEAAPDDGKPAATAQPPAEPAVALNSRGGSRWHGSNQTGPGRRLEGTWVGTVDGKTTTVTHGCPIKGLPESVVAALKASKMNTFDVTKRESL